MSRWMLIICAYFLAFSVGLAVSCGDGDDDNTGDDDSNDDDESGDTWIDPSSGLTWQVTPQSDYMSWEEAKSYCEQLSLDGGGWHLPTISELRTLIRGCDGTETGGSCGVTDDCLDSSCWDESSCSCEYGSGPNHGCYGLPELPGECANYWSSSPVPDDIYDYAWIVSFYGGHIYSHYENNYADARCVR